MKSRSAKTPAPSNRPPRKQPAELADRRVVWVTMGYDRPPKFRRTALSSECAFSTCPSARAESEFDRSCGSTLDHRIDIVSWHPSANAPSREPTPDAASQSGVHLAERIVPFHAPGNHRHEEIHPTLPQSCFRTITCASPPACMSKAREAVLRQFWNSGWFPTGNCFRISQSWPILVRQPSTKEKRLEEKISKKIPE